MTTVGYGDFYARSTLGRLVSVVIALWGIIITSMLVVSLTNLLNCKL